MAADLENDLNASEAVKAAVQDLGFAVRLYSALCNEWSRDSETWACSWRYAGGLVADLRDQGETYLDFYGRGSEGHVASDVRGLLAALGWKPEYEVEGRDADG
jgi:hypothetical protein